MHCIRIGYKLGGVRSFMDVELVVDGKRIPMNDYVRSVFAKVVSALISTLKGVDEDWREARLIVRR